MSKEAVDAFLEKAKGDVALQQRLQTTASSKPDPIGYIVEEAKALGFEFTGQEFMATQQAQQGELSAEQLQTISAGAYMIKWTFRF